MSSNKYLGGGGGAPYASFMAAPGYHGQADIQIHRGQTHREQHSSNIEIELATSLSPDLQSPGHESVSSSVTVASGASSGCRNSTTSTDSGRGSSEGGAGAGAGSRPPAVAASTRGYPHRLSNVSSSVSSVCSGSLSSRQSHHSSSSSIQDRPEDRIFCLNIQEMINSGVADEDILLAWLSDLHFEEYFNLFVSAGYDMPTISRMTPEDLTAIGIKNPAHRKKLKSEISKLSIGDGIPNHVPGSLEEWLRLLRLEEYGPCLVSQGYSSVSEAATISIEDLEDTGFYRLGHQKRLTLAIRRLKELGRGGGGARPPHPPDYYSRYVAQSQEIHVQAAPLAVKPGSFSSFSSPYPGRKLGAEQLQYAPGYSEQPPASLPTSRLVRPYGGGGPGEAEAGGGAGPGGCVPEPMAPLQYPLYKQQLAATAAHHYPGSPRFTPRAAGGLGHPPPPEPRQPMVRSYDDADIVRRSDNSVVVHSAHAQTHATETLPRLKVKPVAKIIASTRARPEPQEAGAEQDWDQKCEDPTLHCDNASLGSLGSLGSPGAGITQLRGTRSGSDVGLQQPRPAWQRQVSLAPPPHSPQMKRNSSFGSETGLPFANDNAGTIRVRSTSASHVVMQQEAAPAPAPLTHHQKRSAGDVLQDIGSMLSDLTDELDAMLKLEKDD